MFPPSHLMFALRVLDILIKSQNADSVDKGVDTRPLPQRDDLCVLLGRIDELFRLVLVLPAIKGSDAVWVPLLVIVQDRHHTTTTAGGLRTR